MLPRSSLRLSWEDEDGCCHPHPAWGLAAAVAAAVAPIVAKVVVAKCFPELFSPQEEGSEGE